MKRDIILTICILLCGAVTAQNSMDDILNLVRENSPRLMAARETMLVEQSDNNRLRKLDNPEVGVNILWGQNDEVGRRNDITVTQSIDLASLTGRKRDLSDSRDSQSSFKYDMELANTLYDARMLLADLVYYNNLKESYSCCLESVERLYESTRKGVENGNATALDLGKVRLKLSDVRAEMSRIETERRALLVQLRALSGSPELEFDGKEFECDLTLLENTEELCQRVVSENPLLKYLSSGIESEEAELDIDRMSWFPKLDVGYMAELGKDEKYRGATVGLSIPLWSNASNVRRSKSALRQAQAESEWQKEQLTAEVRNALEAVRSYHAIAMESQEALEEADNRELLEKALKMGELSLLDYLIEMGMFYESSAKTLQAWLQYHHALAAISRYVGD